jgi:hemolysin D
MALDRQRNYIESAQDLRAQTHSIAGFQTTIAQSQQRAAQITSNYRQQLQNERLEASSVYARQQQERAKLAHRHDLLELKAPQDGVVKDLATHTVGSVVAPGTIVMTLVPQNDPLQAEVWLGNQDVGFVSLQQPVKVKVAAFPFQKFGMLDGTVLHISPDAADAPGARDARDDMPQASYRTVIALDRASLVAGETRYRITPGMKVSAEIHLGTRSVLDYLLSPISRITHEAMRER